MENISFFEKKGSSDLFPRNSFGGKPEPAATPMKNFVLERTGRSREGEKHLSESGRNSFK